MSNINSTFNSSIMRTQPQVINVDEDKTSSATIQTIQSSLNTIASSLETVQKTLNSLTDSQQVTSPVTHSRRARACVRQIAQESTDEIDEVFELSPKPKGTDEGRELGRKNQVARSLIRIYGENIAFRDEINADEFFLRNFWRITTEKRSQGKNILSPSEIRNLVRPKIAKNDNVACIDIIRSNMTSIPDRYQGYGYLDILMLNMRNKDWKSITNFDKKLADSFENIKNLIIGEAYYNITNGNDEAHKFFLKADNFIFSNPRNLYQLANVCYRKGLWKEAAIHFQELLKIEKFDLSYWDPRLDANNLNVTLRHKLGVCFIGMEDWISALTTLVPICEDIVGIQVQSETFGLIAKAYKKLKNDKEFNDWQSRALNLTKEYSDIALDLKYFYQNGNLDKCIPLLLKLSQAYPNENEYIVLIADLSFKLGKWEQAKKYCKSLLQRDPANQNVAIRIAEIDNKIKTASSTVSQQVISPEVIEILDSDEEMQISEVPDQSEFEFMFKPGENDRDSVIAEDDLFKLL